jgi:hypothetical protein
MRICTLGRITTFLAACALLIIPASELAATGNPSFAKPPAPFFHFLWKEEISEPAVRAAVADTTGDGKPRLILLAEKPQQAGLASLIIKKWNGTEFVTEFTGNVDAAPGKLAVGRFAGRDKPAVIVTADALWSWNGTTYVRKPSRTPLSLFGVAKMHSGDERLLVSESPTLFKSYTVNPELADAWLTDRTEAPIATQVDWESMRATPDFFKKMGMPSFLGSGGLITVWDTSKANLPYLYYCRPAPQLDAPQSGAAPKVDSFIAFRDATDASGNELWSTTKLNGLATDMALEDARMPGKRGLLILTSGASAGKARTIYFYGLD